MSPILMMLLVAGNIGLLFLLLGAPLGVRTVGLTRRIAAPPEAIWNAVWPLGRDAGWSGETIGAVALDNGARARLKLSWEGRDGQPIERLVRFEEVTPGRRFSLKVEDDSSLDATFWDHYCEGAEVTPDGDGTVVTLTRTDRYRGAAFLMFRYFALRRQAAKLKRWAETGQYKAGGLFEHPASQFGFAALSALVLWPIFGLTPGGLVIAILLTTVVALHELGHMAAFRLMGHRNVRMIFIPLLGGMAIGGRPYDSRFEVAFVALMGAGFSAFLVPVAIAASHYSVGEEWFAAAGAFGTLAGCAALFNIANLAPVWKFDGGHVLRQICPTQLSLAITSFVLASAFLALGHLAGLSPWMLVAAGIVLAVLSVLTANSGVKPRHELKPIGGLDRMAIGGALVAVFVIHASGVLWASNRMQQLEPPAEPRACAAKQPDYGAFDRLFFRD